MAFKRESRLNRSSIISLVSRKGASWKSPFFRVKFLSARYGNTKVAIITSKKVEKTAVGRNAIRRKISSCFQEVYKESAVKKPFLVIVFPAKEVLNVSDYDELKNEVQKGVYAIENFVFSKKKFHSRKNLK